MPIRAVVALVVVALSALMSPLPVGASAGAPMPGSYGPPLSPLLVLAAFDPPAQPWLSGHRGVDLEATVGTAVRAPAEGVIVFAGRVVDRGVVSIDHEGIRTTYEPVDAAVTTGASVAAGDVIGSIGVGGHCSQRCLHWGALLGTDYVDPLALIGAYSPVLKPPFNS